jgi:hypothetical protein
LPDSTRLSVVLDKLRLSVVFLSRRPLFTLPRVSRSPVLSGRCRLEHCSIDSS